MDGKSLSSMARTVVDLSVTKTFIFMPQLEVKKLSRLFRAKTSIDELLVTPSCNICSTEYLRYKKI